MKRSVDKKKEIEKYLEELESVLPNSLDNYIKDFKIRAVCERYFEKIVEAAVDLAFIVIKEKDMEMPDEDKKSFAILFEAGIISEEISEKMQDAKGMRNIIAHEYGEINDELVFYAVTEELIDDVRKFLEELNERGF